MSKEEISLINAINKGKQTFKFVLSKWKTILIFSIIGGAVGLYLGLISVTKYESKLSFVVQEETPSSGGLASLANSFGLGGGGTSSVFSSSNISDFLVMRNLVQKALMKPVNNNNKLSFAQLYINEYKLNSGWKKNPELKKITFLPTQDQSTFSLKQDSILGRIHDRLTKGKELVVEQMNLDNSIIQIKINTKSELFSMYFSQELIKLVGDYYIETKTKKAKINLSALQNHTDSIRRELLNSLIGVASTTDEVFGLNPAMNVRRVPTAQKQVDVQANTAILAELVKNLEMAKVSLMNQTPLIEVIDKPILPLPEFKTSKLKSIVIYGFVFGFLTALFLVFRNFLKSKLKSSLNEN